MDFKEKIETKHRTVLGISLCLLFVLTATLDVYAATRTVARRASSTKKSSGTRTNKRAASSGRTARKSSSSSSRTNKRAAVSGRTTSGTSSARSSSRSSTKRAAASTRRSAASTKRSSTSQRARYSFSSRAAVATASSTGTTTVKTATASTLCPIEKLLKKTVNDDGADVYYKTRTILCSAPENTEDKPWDMTDSKKLKQFTTKKAWISSDEAVYLECSDGYLLYQSACVSYDDFCPLNEILEKSGKKYTSPYTDDICKVAPNSIAQKVSEEENDSGIVQNKAYRLVCKEGYYTDTDNYVRCLKCPDNGTSTKGENIGVSSCSGAKTTTTTTTTTKTTPATTPTEPKIPNCPAGYYAAAQSSS